MDSDPLGFVNRGLALQYLHAPWIPCHCLRDFWRRSDHTMGQLTSRMSVFLGPYLASGANNHKAVQPGLACAQRCVLVTIGSATFFLFLFLFPNGLFVPLWIQRGQSRRQR